MVDWLFVLLLSVGWLVILIMVGWFFGWLMKNQLVYHDCWLVAWLVGCSIAYSPAPWTFSCRCRRLLPPAPLEPLLRTPLVARGGAQGPGDVAADGEIS